MTAWFTSDPHFRHSNVLNFEERPFETIEQMEKEMIVNWNSVVKKTDTVYLIGDFCFGGVNAWLEILDQLKGDIIFVKGNHDKSKIIKRVFNEGLIKEYHDVGMQLKEGQFTLNMTHYPLQIGLRHRLFSITGHVHSNEHELEPYHINVGVDGSLAKKLGKPFGTPISLEELMLEVGTRHEIVQELKESTNNRK